MQHTVCFRALASVLVAATVACSDGMEPLDISGPQSFDLVIANGRVIDPETDLDAIRHIGVREGLIAAVSELSLDAQLADDGEFIDATGLVVSPGFIDLHAHGQSTQANEYQAHDGVTTALELESGYLGLAEWLEGRRGTALIHYGASAAEGVARALALLDVDERAELEALIRESASEPNQTLDELEDMTRSTFYKTLRADRYENLRGTLQVGLDEGGIGIGMAHQYTPGANREEVFEVFRLAAELDVPIFTHVRSMSLDAMQEVVANASATGAPLHIVHVNSMSLGQLPQVLELIAGAREQGVDITTEAYPYTAGSTGIKSAIFDPGWQDLLGISYGDVQWENTGERLTQTTFEQYREEGGTVIIHMMKDEWIDLAMATPFVMVASDGMPYAPGAHPRSAGTFSRVLGRYVRERGVLDLPTAIAKMTYMPAKRLEEIAPIMARKGRIQVGADADLTVFDPKRVIDTATFEEDLSFSVGIEHVFVLGTAVVKNGETIPDTYPGQPILGRFATGS
jgi:cytosine/adenosine deaminase-related metal-dependent hydrolase